MTMTKQSNTRADSGPMVVSGRGVIAVLGPTNTGKTHYAIERMTAHSSGVIGLPLRLLAREVYTRIVERMGLPAIQEYYEQAHGFPIEVIDLRHERWT